MKKIIIFGIIVLCFEFALGDSFNQEFAHGNYWRVSKGLAESNLNGNPLFASTRSITVFAYNSDPPHQNNRYGVMVVSDPMAGRLIVASGSGYSTLTEYGFEMDLAAGLASSPEKLVFATTLTGRIYILYYHTGTKHLVNAPRNWVYFTTGSPVDICWDDGGTVEFGNDSFWVAHFDEGSISKYRYSFDWSDPGDRFEYSHKFTEGGFENPISIARGRDHIGSGIILDDPPGGNPREPFSHNEWFYVLERSGTIHCYTNAQQPPHNDNADRFFEFSYTPGGDVRLTSLAVDHLGIIWGTDTNNHRIITYYNDESTLVPLDTMFSYGIDNSRNQLCLPRDISTMEVRMWDDQGQQFLIDPYPLMHIQEKWSPTTGGVKGTRGYAFKYLVVDWDLPLDPYTRPLAITYRLTSFSGGEDLIIENSSQQVIRTIQLPTVPGPNEEIWDGKNNLGQQMPEGLYTFKIANFLETTFDTHLPSNYLKEAISGTLDPANEPYHIYENAWVSTGNLLKIQDALTLYIYPDRTLTAYGTFLIDCDPGEHAYVKAYPETNGTKIYSQAKAEFKNGAIISFSVSTAGDGERKSGEDLKIEKDTFFDEILKPENEAPVKQPVPPDESFEKSEQKKEDEGIKEKKKPEPQTDNKEGVIK
jgi:hypothetical protein